MQYLSKHNNDAEMAWYSIRAYRDSYRGLKEDVRNAEHTSTLFLRLEKTLMNGGKCI